MKKKSILATALSLALISTNIIRAHDGEIHEGEDFSQLKVADINGTWKIFTNKDPLSAEHHHDESHEGGRVIELYNLKFHAGHNHPAIKKKLKNKKSFLTICSKDGDLLGGKYKQAKILTGEGSSKRQILNSNFSIDHDMNIFNFEIEDPESSELQTLNFKLGDDGNYWLGINGGDLYLAKKMKGKKRNNPKYCKNL